MKIDKDLALFYGILLGDGCLSESKKYYHYNIYISGNLRDDLSFYEFVLKKLIFKLRGKETTYQLRPKDNGIRFQIGDKAFFNKIKSLGFKIGKKGPNIKIPKIFHERNLMKYITQGFFAT